MYCRLLLLVAALAFIASCVTPSGGPPVSVDRATRLQERGDNAGAAAMFERLAQNNPLPDRTDFAMAAARAWLAANRADDAQRVLELATGETRAPALLELGMLRAQVAEARGQFPSAWQQISQLPQPADPAVAVRLLLLREQIALRVGQPAEAVRAGIARERLATTEEQRTAARRELLSGLRGAVDNGLRIDLGASPDPMVRGWLELAQIASSASRSPLAAEADIERWRRRYPGHPGSTIVDREILHPAEHAVEARPGFVASTGPVALLLPLSGPQAAVATLVRDGFQAALARLPEAERPVLRIYDTSVLPIGTALLNAQSDGASIAVGPLLRDAVQEAYEQRPGALPLLLLNTLPGNGFVGNQIYQFALSAEDEARQVARQIAGSGHTRALLFAPVGDWGTRAAMAFSDELVRDGGSVVAQGVYTYDRNDRSRTDVTATVTRTLGIDEARSRYERLRQIVGGSMQFRANPRPDVDAIFVAGYEPLATRELNSQLFFNNAGELPTYMTNDGLAADGGPNRDLEGMRVLGTPWELDTVGPVADLRTATEQFWATQGQRNSRYFAFGYDAATLAIALRRGVTTWPLAGLSGRLQMTPEGRIERSLTWGRIKNGQVQPFDPMAN
jgi:outer membrane PBP1 activator LpoA protein